MHKVYNNISLAYKAKKLVIGSEEVISLIKSSKDVLVLMSSKSSINTFKMIQNKTNSYNANLVILDDINNNLDKIFKGKQVKVMAIKDKGFKNLVYKNMKE